MWRVAVLILMVGCGGDDDGGADGAGGGGPDAAVADATVDSRLADAAPGSLGEPCEGAGECTSGECTNLLGMASSTYCTASCDAVDTECPEDGVCFVPGDFAGVCARPCTDIDGACALGLECKPVDGVEQGCIP